MLILLKITLLFVVCCGLPGKYMQYNHGTWNIFMA